ncbi:MAG: aspartate kinase, partial [Synergistaceae bacterium]|nr:aspartate kinase [Synergistaceae bacterium]
MNNTIVLRFTENTISSAERIKQAAQIAKSNPAYKYAILSAPGKSSGDDIKVTDVLYMCHSQFINGEDYHEMLGRLRKTFENLLEGLGIEFDLYDEIKEIEKSLITGRNADFIASRGEYLISKIFAQLLGWEFIDAEEIIFFRPDGKLDDDKTIRVAGERLKRSEYAVIPSFYGTAMNNGKHVKTFPRGQCDTTGAVVSRAVNADYLEKWMYKTRPYSADP